MFGQNSANASNGQWNSSEPKLHQIMVSTMVPVSAKNGEPHPLSHNLPKSLPNMSRLRQGFGALSLVSSKLDMLFASAILDSGTQSPQRPSGPRRVLCFGRIHWLQASCHKRITIARPCRRTHLGVSFERMPLVLVRVLKQHPKERDEFLKGPLKPNTSFVCFLDNHKEHHHFGGVSPKPKKNRRPVRPGLVKPFSASSVAASSACSWSQTKAGLSERFLDLVGGKRGEPRFAQHWVVPFGCAVR